MSVEATEQRAGDAGPPAINGLTREDFAFYEVPVDCDDPTIRMSTPLRGVKSREGYMFLHRGFNQFDTSETAIPENAEHKAVPPDEWIAKYFCDPAKRRLTADRNALPALASGTAYGTRDNGGMPFVVYVRDNGVSVFRMPSDGYLLDDDWRNDFETDRLFYTDEVASFQCDKVWVGEDPDWQEGLGNSLLLRLKDTQTYVHVGAEIYRFNLQEPVVQYFSKVGNSCVPYPVGLTESRALFMLDRVSVPRESLAQAVSHEGVEDWADAYRAFYDFEGARTPFDLCEQVCAGILGM
jgi:hypothetical protein